MKKNIINLLALFITFSLIYSCDNNSDRNKNDLGSDTNLFNQLVADWNKAHNSKDSIVFSTLFADSILFYGVKLEKNHCIENKFLFFKKHPDFYQQIYGDIAVDKINDNEVKCNFIKRVTFNKVTSDYPTYLVFKKSDDIWEIVTEGDLNDMNLSNKTNIAPIYEVIFGDYNGDGKLEYMWLEAPNIKVEEWGEGDPYDYTCYVKFSDPNIPTLKIEGAPFGNLLNEGDLNKNGTDEIGFYDPWFTSLWDTYHVWTFKNGKWVNAVESISIHVDHLDYLDVQLDDLIEIDPKKEGNVIIRYSDFPSEEEGIILKSKSVKIVK
jgi:hypothetical protein